MYPFSILIMQTIFFPQNGILDEETPIYPERIKNKHALKKCKKDTYYLLSIHTANI